MRKPSALHSTKAGKHHCSAFRFGKSGKMKRLSIVLVVCLGLLLLINLVVGIFSPDQWAIDTALAKCREQGWENLDLSRRG